MAETSAREILEPPHALLQLVFAVLGAVHRSEELVGPGSSLAADRVSLMFLRYVP